MNPPEVSEELGVPPALGAMPDTNSPAYAARATFDRVASAVTRWAGSPRRSPWRWERSWSGLFWVQCFIIPAPGSSSSQDKLIDPERLGIEGGLVPAIGEVLHRALHRVMEWTPPTEPCDSWTKAIEPALACTCAQVRVMREHPAERSSAP